MKKFLLALFLICLIVIYAGPGADLFSKLLRLESPKVHEIQTGEWLSKLAEQYYGDASYWEELALVNRAPNGNRIFPGEEIVVPSFEAIRTIRESRSITAVNQVLSEQQNILAGKMTYPAPEPAPEPQAPAVAESSTRSSSEEEDLLDENPAPVQLREASAEFEDELETSASDEDGGSLLRSTPFVTGIAVLGVIVAVAVFIFGRRKKEREEIEIHDDQPDEETYKGKPLFTFDDFHKDDEQDEDDKPEKRRKDEKKSVEIA